MSGYPDNWPNCPGCGEPAMDGHITCGQAKCEEQSQRNILQKVYQFSDVIEAEFESFWFGATDINSDHEGSKHDFYKTFNAGFVKGCEAYQKFVSDELIKKFAMLSLHIDRMKGKIA